MDKQNYFNPFRKSKSDYDYEKIPTADPAEPRHSITIPYGNFKPIISNQSRPRSKTLGKELPAEKPSNYRPRSVTNPKIIHGNMKHTPYVVPAISPYKPDSPSNLISNEYKDMEANNSTSILAAGTKEKRHKVIRYISLPFTDPKVKRHSAPDIHHCVDPNLPDVKKLRATPVCDEYTSKAKQSQPESKNKEYISKRVTSLREKWLPKALNSMEERHTKIQNLDNRIENLEDNAKLFEKTTKETVRKLWWKSCFGCLCRKKTIVIIVIIVILLAITIVLSIAFR